MDYNRSNLEELQNIFDNEENIEKLNQITGAIAYKHEVLLDNSKETNYVLLRGKICQQINLIRLENLNVLQVEESKRKVDKKYEKNGD